MGMRLNKGNARAALVVAAILVTMIVNSCFGTVFADTKSMTAEERRAALEKQQQQEQAVKAQKASDSARAQQTVDQEIASQQMTPGKPEGLKASTSVSTNGIASTKAAKGYRYVTLKWNAVENATGYQVYYSYKKNGTFKVKGKPVTENTKKMLFKNNREVFFKVAAVNGDNVGTMTGSVVIWPGYGDYVNATKISITKSQSVLLAGFTSVFKVNTSASMLKTYKIKWSSSNKEVATVSSSGKVTALKAGTTKIIATSHAGFKASKTVTVKMTTPSGVPDVVGLTKSQAKKVMNNAGFKTKFRTQYIKKKVLNKKYPGASMGTCFKQSQEAGAKIQKGSTITISIADEIYDCGVGVEAMVKWAEAVAADDSYGYSMGVYTGRGLDRLCPYTNAGASKDYDCATFVNAALAYSGMGDDYMKATHKPSPVVRGVKALMIKNGWKKVLIKGRKPTVKQLKRGDIVLDVTRHIQIHAGNGMDVGAHNNYDGRSGDSSGREVSVNYSWAGYAEVYRYYGDIGKKSK